MSEKDPTKTPATREIWRERLAVAEKAHRDAAAALNRAIEEHGESPNQASIEAVAEARERKAAARAEYLRVLRIFTDLVLRGKIPGRSAS